MDWRKIVAILLIVGMAGTVIFAIVWSLLHDGETEEETDEETVSQEEQEVTTSEVQTGES